MLLSTTKREPAHYMLKIENFSVLSEDQTIKIESDVFEASGHEWRLGFYPNGHADVAEVGDHISLYLTLIGSTECDSNGWEIHVDVKFFVYNYIDHKYVTFQDVDEKGTKFHVKQREWGFDKLISLEHFKDTSKGYLFNDSCVFEAEIFPAPEAQQYTLKDRCLSMIKPPATMNTYTWSIDKFSFQTKINLTSEVFKIGNIKWTLSIFPRGESGNRVYMLIHLNVHEAASFPDGWTVYAKYEHRFKNHFGYADVAGVSDHWFCKSASMTSDQHFTHPNELCDIKRGFLVNDRLIVEAKISVIGMLRNFIRSILFSINVVIWKT